MKNPVTVASGTFGYGEEFDRYFDVSLLGAVTTKSISLKPRAGNKPPRLVETPAGLLNAIGLQNVGIERFLSQKVPYLRKRNATIIANIYGYSPEEYAELARRLEAEGAADAIEANLSCPNVHDARTAKGAVLVSQSCEAITVYTRAIREATRLPLYIKLTPNVMNIQEPALAAEAAGADGVCLINTLLGMAINPETRKPRLANIVGGRRSGHPPGGGQDGVGCRAVLRIPIIGTGDQRGGQRHRVSPGGRDRGLRRLDVLPPPGYRPPHRGRDCRVPQAAPDRRCEPTHWSHAGMKRRTELITGLDVDTREDALAAVEIAAECSWFKIGAQLFTRCGPAVVEAVRDRGKNVS